MSFTPGDSTIDNITFATLLLQSFRYCLGRRSYAVGDFVPVLTKYWHILPGVWQKQVQRDIQDAMDKGWAGDSWDVSEWQSILKLEPKEE